nr:hypothetical protein [Tanacetum cinerariifolium]
MIENIDQDAGVILVTLTKVSSQEDQPKDQLGVLSAAKILADATRVQTYNRRRRAVSTGSGEVSTANMIISTAKETISTVGMVQGSTSSLRTTKDKGKAIMTESEPEQTTTKLRERQERDGYKEAIRLQEQQDKEENKRIARDAKIAQRLQEEIDVIERQRMAQRLQAEEREKYSEDDRTKMLVDLINQRKKFFAQQRAEAKRNKPMIQTQKRTSMSNYIKHMGSYTLKQLKKMSFKEIRELFEATMRRIQDFVPIEREGDKEVSKFAGAGGSKRDAEEELDQGSSKKQKTNKASGSVQEQPIEEEKYLSQEDLQQLMIIAPKIRNHTKVYQFFDDMLKVFDMDDLVQLWSLVKERFSSTEPNDDKDRVLWVELKRLFKPDVDDELWKLQRYMHDLLKWRLYDTRGVHHVSTERGHDIFMLVEKDYPLTKRLMTVMLVNKLQVDEFSKMENELLRKIIILANNPRQ